MYYEQGKNNYMHTIIYINEDSSKRMREGRHHLWESARDNRTNGDKVNSTYEWIRINGTTHVWREEKKQRVKLQTLFLVRTRPAEP